MSIPATCPHVFVCAKCGNRIGTPIAIEYAPVCGRHTRATGGAQTMREVTTPALPLNRQSSNRATEHRTRR